MSFFIVDVEADGPIPGRDQYSMVSFGAVKVAIGLEDEFYSQVLPPISNKFVPDALAVSGATRNEMESSLIDIPDTMHLFSNWIFKTNAKGTAPVFVSDNNGFDWSFINWYFHAFNNGKNPFGHSSRRLGDMYSGFFEDSGYAWKKHRKTKHTHHPVDDAKGNAEALLHLHSMGYKIKLE